MEENLLSALNLRAVYDFRVLGVRSLCSVLSLERLVFWFLDGTWSAKNAALTVTRDSQINSVDGGVNLSVLVSDNCHQIALRILEYAPNLWALLWSVPISVHGHRILLVLLQSIKLYFDLDALVTFDLSELDGALDILRESARLLLRLDLLSRQSGPRELACGYLLLLLGSMYHESQTCEQ